MFFWAKFIFPFQAVILAGILLFDHSPKSGFSLKIAQAQESVSKKKGPLPKRLPEKKKSKSALKKKIKKKKRKAEFAGVIQFVRGKSYRKKDKKPIRFKAVIPTNRVYTVEKDSYVKVITRENCVGIIYGPGQFKPHLLPEKEGILWRIGANSLRWICPGSSQQKVFWAQRILNLKSAEIFIHEKQVWIRSGSVTDDQKQLTSPSFHLLKNKELKNESLPDGHQLYAFHNSLPVPKESLKLEEPKEKDIKSRWAIQFSPGGGEVKHENSRFSRASFEYEGMAPTFHYRIGKDKSLIGAFAIGEWSEPGQGYCRDGNCDYAYDKETGKYNRYELFLAEIGLRTQHRKNWSTYFRIGIGKSSYYIDQFIQEFPSSVQREFSYTVVSGVVGIDRFFKWSDRLGLYLNAEIRLTQTLDKGDAKDQSENQNGPGPYVPSDYDNLNGTISTSGFSVGIGPMLFF